MWIVKVGGNDEELRPWHSIYEGSRGQRGTLIMALLINIKHQEWTDTKRMNKSNFVGIGSSGNQNSEPRRFLPSALVCEWLITSAVGPRWCSRHRRSLHGSKVVY